MNQQQPCEFGGTAFQGFGHYMVEKTRKLNEQFQQDVKVVDSKLFQGVRIYITGHTEPSFQELRRLIGEHGGGFCHYDSPATVTHVIATNLSRSKSRDFINRKVVRPEWIVRSIEANRLLPWSSFRLETAFTDTLQTRLPFAHVENGVSFCQETELGLEGMPSGIDLERGPLELQRPTESREDPKDVDDTLMKVSPKVAIVPHLNETDWRSNTSMQAGFVRKFFQASRLHHLSTWKNELRRYSFPFTLTTKHSKQERIVIHVDMDCFFASIALRDRPHLHDKPVGVSHGSGQGSYSSDVASCNYLARESGVRNGMHTGKAKQLCPDLVILPYEFDKYRQATQQLYEVLTPLADGLNAASCDEALLDVTSKFPDPASKHTVNQKVKLCPQPDYTPPSNMFQDLPTLFEYIYQRIYSLTGCTASLGCGENILMARLATKQAKPSGWCHYQPASQDQLFQFLDPLPIDTLPGIGYALREKLESTPLCGDVRRKFTRPVELQSQLGTKLGQKVYDYVRGVDAQPVYSEESSSMDSMTTKVQRKSIGVDINWGIRFETDHQFKRFLMELVEEVCRRLADSTGFPPPPTKAVTEDATWLAGSLTLKLRLRHPEAPVEPPKFLGCGHCVAYSHSMVLEKRTASPYDIYEHVQRILSELKMRLNSFHVTELRGVGIMTSRLAFFDGHNIIHEQSSPSKNNDASGFAFKLNDFFTKRKEETSLQAKNIETPLPTTPVKQKTIDDWQRLSEISTNLLQEMPTDIRKEFEQVIHQKRPRSPSGSPCTSRVVPKQNKQIKTKRSPKRNGVTLTQLWQPSSPPKRANTPPAIINGEQIDYDTWNALPSSVQQEVLEQSRTKQVRPKQSPTPIEKQVKSYSTVVTAEKSWVNDGKAFEIFCEVVQAALDAGEKSFLDELQAEILLRISEIQFESVFRLVEILEKRSPATEDALRFIQYIRTKLNEEACSW